MIVLRKNLILASRSPRRQALLRQIGLQFDVAESGVEEDVSTTLKPDEYVTVLSRRKAQAVGEKINDAFVLGADTIVVLNGQIIGKPASEREAHEMLRLLSGRTHVVYTGFTILDRPSNKFVSDHEATRVTFRQLPDDEIAEYVATGSPMDKAGAYGIQDDYGAVFVEKVDGCFYNVVGFPLAKFYLAMLRFQHELEQSGLL